MTELVEKISAGGLHVITKDSLRMTLDEAFPECDPLVEPLGNKVLLQLRNPKKMVGKIHLASETQDQEKFVTSVAKVLAMGKIAYHRRDTGEEWPEGVWVKVGMFVRCPKFGGDRWELPTGNLDQDQRDIMARFVLFDDHEIFGHIYGDPIKIRDYI
jgi:hypothetical protein